MSRSAGGGRLQGLSEREGREQMPNPCNSLEKFVRREEGLNKGCKEASEVFLFFTEKKKKRHNLRALKLLEEMGCKTQVRGLAMDKGKDSFLYGSAVVLTFCCEFSNIHKPFALNS